MMNHSKLFVQAILLLGFCITCFQTLAQERIAYYDALTLSQSYESNQANALPLDNITWKILQYYFPSQTTLKRDVAQNEFLANYFQTGGIASIGLTASQEIIQKGAITSAGGVAGLNVTNVADGLAKFLVERAKQELSITFFSKFKKVLDDPANKDFKDLFPKTYAVLTIIDKEVYQYSNYLNTLKEAFENDLQNILNNLESYLEAKKTLRYQTNSNDPIGMKIEYFESALLIVNNLRQGVHPAEAIQKLANQKYHPDNEPMLAVQDATKLFDIFSNSLKSVDPDRYWVDSNSLKLLLDATTFNIYLGLLYQQHKTDTIFGKPFSTYLDSVASGKIKIEKYQGYIENLIQDSELITLAIQGIKEKKKSGEKIDSYGELFHSTFGFIKNFKNVEMLDSSFTIADLDEVLDVLEILNDIYLDVNERKYNALILDLSELLTQLFGEFGWNDELIKYGSFIANVAQADNSDEVEAAIEAIALPVGSASIKRKSKSNIALNAYVGLSPTYEYNGGIDKWKYGFGVHAPIGIAFSWGKFDAIKNKEKGSNTLFLTLIDLGAVTTYRFGDSETENIPEIKLENIFAPGAYYVCGLPNVPISIGLGGQFGPQLRAITDDTISLNSKISFTFKIFVAVDIPLLNFYTKSR